MKNIPAMTRNNAVFFSIVMNNPAGIKNNPAEIGSRNIGPRKKLLLLRTEINKTANKPAFVFQIFLARINHARDMKIKNNEGKNLNKNK